MIGYNKEEDTIELYQRIDTRGKDPPSALRELPSDGGNTTKYTSPDGKEHTYYMEKIVLLETDGKKQKKNKKIILDVLERHKTTFKELIEQNSSDFVSVEIVGTKYNRTPGVAAPAAIAPHCLQKVVLENKSLPRTYEEAKQFLLSSGMAVEGLVVEYNGKYWKLRSDMFDPNCDFVTNKSKVMPPIVFLD
jgi:hypothetical protein